VTPNLVCFLSLGSVILKARRGSPDGSLSDRIESADFQLSTSQNTGVASESVLVEPIGFQPSNQAIFTQMLEVSRVIRKVSNQGILS
jgi:hypothetical protein